MPSKTQIYAAEHSPLRLSTIQLQAQAEIVRRRSRHSLAAQSLINGDNKLGRNRSLEWSRLLGHSTSVLYGPSGRRAHGGAPLLERAIKRHASKRDGYETLSLVHVPRLEVQTGDTLSTVPSTSEAKKGKLRGSAFHASQTNRIRSKLEFD